MWLKKLKTALVLEEVETVSSLLETMPQFASLQEMEEAAFLLQQCKLMIETKKIETSHTLQQLKNSLDFLKSTEQHPSPTLNLKF